MTDLNTYEEETRKSTKKSSVKSMTSYYVNNKRGSKKVTSNREKSNNKTESRNNIPVTDNSNRNPVKYDGSERSKNATKNMKKASLNEEMQKYYNQTFGERLVKTIGNTGLELLSTASKGVDIFNENLLHDRLDNVLVNGNDTFNTLNKIADIAKVINPELSNFKATNENSISSILSNKVEENNKKIYEGTNGLEQFALQTVEGVTNYGGHLLLSLATGGAINPVTTMALQGGTDKTYQNLQEGYDMEISLGNGTLTGVMSALTERLPFENLEKIVNSKLGQFSIAALATQAASEGVQEGIEYGIEPIIDKFTLGKQVEYNTGELFMTVALGMSSGGIIGAAANVVPVVKSRKNANQLQADIDTLNEFKNTTELSNEEINVIDQAIRLAQKAINQFNNTSVIGDAVTLESDQVKKLSSSKIKENFNKYLQPQIDIETRFNESQQAVSNIIKNAQNVLNQKGINMDAVQYSNLTDEVRNQVDKVQSYADDLGVKIVFDSSIDSSGMFNNGVVYVNPESDLAPLTTFVHELTHGNESSKYYSVLKKLILENENTVELNNQLQFIKDHYSKNGIDLDTDGLIKEFIAIKTQDSLGNDKFVERLVNYNNSLATRIYEEVKKIVSSTDNLQDIEYNFLKAFRNKGTESNQATVGYRLNTQNYSESNSEYFANAKYSKGLSTKELNRNYKQYKDINNNFSNGLSEFVNAKYFDKEYQDLVSSITLEQIKNGSISEESITKLKNETWDRMKVEFDNPNFENYNQIKNFINNEKISLQSIGITDERFRNKNSGVGDFQGRTEWNQFRKSMFGKMKFVKEGGRDIDQIYNEIVNSYPGLFNEDLTSSYDQLMELADFLNNKQNEKIESHLSETDNINFDDISKVIDEKIENMSYSVEMEKNLKSFFSSKNIYSQPDKAILQAGNLIPNHSIIRSKWPHFSDINLNKALLELYVNGRASDETKNALKNDIYEKIYSDSETGKAESSLQVDRFLDDSIEYFLTNSKYESNKEYMSSIASKVNKLLNAYSSLNSKKIEETYDKVDSQTKAKELLKQRKIGRKIHFTEAVENLVNNGSNKRMSLFKTLEQNLDTLADGNVELRKDLRDTLEMKRYESQIEYIDTLNKYNEVINEVVKLGIREGSKESKATQWLMETHKEDGSPFTNNDLYAEFDYKMKNGKMAYENIENAANMLRSSYDEIFKTINDIRANIYGDIELNNELSTEELRAQMYNAKHKVTMIKDELKTHSSEKLQAVLDEARGEYRKYMKQYSAKIERDENGDSTRRQQLQYRKNYAHHVVRKGFFESLFNSIEGKSVKEVPTYLAGVSDEAEPKSGFAKFFSKQTGGSYEADAVLGFSEYIKDASRIIAYDPYIEYLRDFTDDLRATAQDDNMSQFTRYLTDYANDLAGKTGQIDRAVRGLVGDKVFGVLKKLNSRVKANAILGNVRTATTQIFNIPNAMGVLVDKGGSKSIVDIMKGSEMYFKSLLDSKNDISSISPFLCSRYFDTDTGKIGVGATLENLSNFMLSKGDEIATKMIWHSAYQQALRTKQENPVFYADDLTRRSVAGRGVGEVPIALQSQFMNLMIPFQVETNNAFRTLASKVKDKSVASVLTILIANWLFNNLSEWLYKDRVLYDPIDVADEAINQYKENGEINPKELALRLTGETLSSVPGGSYIPMLFGLSDYDTEKMFGDSDPSRYGTGNIGLSVLGSSVKDIYNNQYLDAASDLAANFALPGGGKQLQRTIEALQVNGMLPQVVNGQIIQDPIYYTKNGKVGYVTDPESILDSPANAIDFARQILFGKWSGQQAREYLDGNTGLRSDNQNNLFNEFKKQMSAFDAYNKVKQTNNVKESLKDIENEKNGYADTNGVNLKSIDSFKDGLSGKTNSKSKFIDYIDESDYSSEQKNYIFDEYYGKSALTEYINSFADDNNLDDEQRYSLKSITANAKGKTTTNGDLVKNSKALEVRKKLEDIGVYDKFVDFVNENDLDVSFVGLNKTVLKMSSEEFDSNYDFIFNSPIDVLDTYSNTTVKNKNTSKKKTNKSSETYADKNLKIDKILAKAHGNSTSSKSSYDIVNDIVNKNKSSKKLVNSAIKSKNSDLIKSYLKTHSYDRHLFN